jgi:hypothetical protein
MPGDKPVIEISDDKRVEEPAMVNEKDAKEEEDIEALARAPDWLPDGWIMEVYREEDGTIRRVCSLIPNMHKHTLLGHDDACRYCSIHGRTYEMFNLCRLIFLLLRFLNCL